MDKPEWDKNGHQHENLDMPKFMCGEAYDDVYTLTDGTMRITNGEYESQVNFCPVCGYKAAVQVTGQG